ncbi:hypothetical protein GGS24DRAFT_341648 [Hypoxylon argillaceum]|nr:hypothetical protein GGS24DRAFT_341648 [Hypoxylon argillaceum]
MSLLCCCRNRQPAGKETQTQAIDLPTQPPRVRLSRTLSRSDTNMYLSSLLASRGPSQVVIPAYHNIVDPEAVDVEDSDEDVLDRDADESKTRKLGSFRTRLIRRLSHRADAKASPRPSAGTSDEELARRAELKRLMHKRIQEELRSEEEEDEDDNDDIKLAPSRQPSINNCREPELPGGGPRDTIEFSVSSVDEQEVKKEVSTPPETSLSPTSTIDGPQEPRSPTSRSESVKRPTDNSYHECNASLNEMGSVIQPPSPSHLTPVHLLGGSGRESPSTASWRLSYSAIHIESYIEPLVEARQVSCPPSPEPENSFPKQEADTTHLHEADATANCSNLTMQDETIDTGQTMESDQCAIFNRNYKESDVSSDLAETSDERYSPLDIWLRSQDLHCASILSSHTNSEMALEHYEHDVGEQVEDLQKSQNFTGLSRHKDQTKSGSSILQEHSLGTWSKSAKRIDRIPLMNAPSSEYIASNEGSGRIENEFPLEEPSTEGQPQDVSSRYTSSRYTTRPNSQQENPRSSHPSLAELLVSRRIQQPLPPIYGSVNPYRTTTSDNSEISSYQTALNKTPSNHAKSNPELSQFPIAEVLSGNASETESFKQREEELKSIKKRFGLTPARRYPMESVRSKFKEEFEDPRGSNSRRSSIFSKLYFAFPKRARASGLHTELNKNTEEAGIHSIDPRNEMKPTSSDSNEDQYQLSSTARLEERAIEQRATKQEDCHQGKLKAKLTKVSMPITSTNNAEALSVPVNNCPPDITKTSSMDEAGKTQVENSFPRARGPNNIEILNEDTINSTFDIHTGVLQGWVEQLQAEDVKRQSRTEPRIGLPKRQPPRFRAPPESWAKWPSHTRKERTASAGKKDNVNTKDFAVVINAKSSAAEAECEALPTGRELTVTSRTLPSQVSKALKSGWNKMITRTGSFGRAPDHGHATQSSHKSRGFLEYPELELLPTAEGYREMQALNQQIDAMKRRSTSGTIVIREPSSDSARHPLASRIAEEVHRFQVKGKDIAWTDPTYGVTGPQSSHFLSPTHSLYTRRSKSCDPDLFCPPESQSPYEDCVQTQMLHDDYDSNRAEGHDRATIKRAKSTGNIEVKLQGDAPPLDEITPSNHGPVHKAWRSGLRRHKSLGWIRGRGHGGNEDKLAEVR